MELDEILTLDHELRSEDIYVIRVGIRSFLRGSWRLVFT